MAPVALLGLGLAWCRERRARHRTNRETWALLPANLTLRESAQALLQEARHDPPTGLDNRRAWRETLEPEARRAARYGGEPAVIMLDLDGFKAVNDSLGHEAGDDVLVRVSDASAAACVRAMFSPASAGTNAAFSCRSPSPGRPPWSRRSCDAISRPPG